jgi:phosphatidylglycerophosphate synthase
MFDRYLLPAQKRLLYLPAKMLVERGVTANAITVAGFAVGICGVVLLAGGLYLAALLCIVVNRVFDGLDGAVANLAGPTDRGAFLDISLDFFFYAAIPFGFAFADPGTNALPAAGLIVAFVGTGSSFLAFATIAARRQLTSIEYPRKGLYYVGGLTEGAETIAVFSAMCLWPTLFPLLAWTFAALCLVTTITRWTWGWRAFSDDQCQPDHPLSAD